ncbi:MAG TPA: hypothetical protein VGO62_08035 [Myxococcota bacterium]|jgi:iron-sulfur cluster repair protein YtfE (RIC family)
MTSQMKRHVDKNGTCHLLITCYHRTFAAELPHIERVALRVACLPNLPHSFARELFGSILSLKEELQRYTATAEIAVYPFAGTRDGALMVDEHAHGQRALMQRLTHTREVASRASTASRIAMELRDALVQLEERLLKYFALERTLGTAELTVPDGDPVEDATSAA